jgi:hypothetical protein
MDSIGNEVVTGENQEEDNYHSFQINTRNALDLIFEIQDYDQKIEHDLLVELRKNLEYVLHRRVQPTLKFKPVDWEYHKNKYLQWEKKEWSNEGANVFNPDYFMFDASHSGEIRYNSLSDDEKIKVDKSAKKAKEENWKKWGYDVFSLNSNCPLSIEKDGEEFQFFFAWQLRFTDYFEIKKFLNWHLENTFENAKESCIEFVEILFLKYKKILNDETNRKLVFDCLEKMKIEPITTQMTITEIVENTFNKSRRKTKEKIEIPIPPKRNKEKWTIFSKDDTIKLFDYLIQLGCLVNDTKKVSKESIAKAIYAITGYWDNDTAEMFVFENKKPKTKKEKEIIIENIKELIINNL